MIERIDQSWIFKFFIRMKHYILDGLNISCARGKSMYSRSLEEDSMEDVGFGAIGQKLVRVITIDGHNIHKSAY